MGYRDPLKEDVLKLEVIRPRKDPILCLTPATFMVEDITLAMREKSAVNKTIVDHLVDAIFEIAEQYNAQSDDMDVELEYPLVVGLANIPRPLGLIIAVSLLFRINEKLPDGFPFTLDWWSRTLADNGTGPMFIGIRRVGLEELVGHE